MLRKRIRIISNIGAVLVTGLISIICPAQQNTDSIKILRIDAISSPSIEANVCVSTNRDKLYFMSTRGGQRWSTEKYSFYKGKYHADGDLYTSERKNGSWSEPKNMGLWINTSSSEDEPIYLIDNESILHESWRDDWEESGGPYYIKYKDGRLESLHSAITWFFKRNELYATDGATLSPNKEIFVFAAGKNMDSNMELYFIDLKSPNPQVEWLPINTEFNERTPYFAPDGITFYFASDGYGGLGGLDVFKTTWLNGRFGEIINLGAPINSAMNDCNFTISGSGNWAYMIKNDDIYEVDFSRASDSLKPVSSYLCQLKLSDCTNNKSITKYRVYNSKEGQSQYTDIDSDENVIFYYNSSSYISKANYAAKKVTQEAYNLEYCLKKAGDINIYFEYDSYTVNEKYFFDLQFDPNKHYLIIGMTDMRGKTDYNLRLAQKRALEVQNKMIENGISIQNIEMIWVGEKYANQNTASDKDRRVVIKELDVD